MAFTANNDFAALASGWRPRGTSWRQTVTVAAMTRDADKDDRPKTQNETKPRSKFQKEATKGGAGSAGSRRAGPNPCHTCSLDFPGEQGRRLHVVSRRLPEMCWVERLGPVSEGTRLPEMCWVERLGPVSEGTRLPGRCGVCPCR